MSIYSSDSIKVTLDKATIPLTPISLSPMLDAEVLLGYTLNKTREFIYAHPEKRLTKLQIKKFEQLLIRRTKHEPIAYIIGYKEFYGLRFKVNRNTLIPRPETELIVDNVLNIINSKPGPAILIDLGTGTGCIPISILKNTNKKISAYAIDISSPALKTAKANERTHKISGRIKFLTGNLLRPMSPIITKATKDNAPPDVVITANLPYLSEEIYKSASRDVKLYEPKNALYGGKDGLKYYRILFNQLNDLMARQNFSVTLLCEIDPSQKNSIRQILNSFFPHARIEIKKDLAGLDRLCIICLNHS